MIVENEHGHILLVRHSYCEPESWMLPAGRMGRRERPTVAAGRELHEEVNCVLENARLVEFEDASYWGRRYRTYIVGGVTRVVPQADLREIEEAAFFPLFELPETVSEPTLARLERWQLRNSLALPVPAFIRHDYLKAHLATEGSA